MQMVDILHGVTMGEPGVSRLVSVNMNTALDALKAVPSPQAGAPTAKAKDPSTSGSDDAAQVA